MSLPINTEFKSLDYVFQGEPFTNTASKTIETRGLDLVLYGEPFGVSYEMIISLSGQFEITPSFQSVPSLILHNTVFEITPSFVSVIERFFTFNPIFETGTEFSSVFELIFPNIVFDSSMELSGFLYVTSYLPIEGYEVIFDSIIEFLIDFELTVEFDGIFLSNLSLHGQISFPEECELFFQFPNGLELGFQFQFSNVLQQDFETEFMFVNMLTSYFDYDFIIGNQLLGYNEVSKSFVFLNRVGISSIDDYSGFVFSKIHGIE